MSKKKRSIPPPSHPPSPEAAPAQPPSLSLGKKCAFGMLAMLLAFGLLEALLALAGFKPRLYDTDPYVGFSSKSPLFVEERDASGQTFLVTARNRLSFFNAQRFPKVKGPGVHRLFSMGESTTYGHPYSDPTSFNGWLRELLKATTPETHWEAINAGGISYGSYRIASLMEELIQYQPDLFVIYCGHNEFLEKRIYNQVARMPRGFHGLAGLASRSRSATLLQNLLAPLRQLDRSERAAKTILEGEPVTLLDDTLGPTAYTRDEALREQILQHYRFNLLRMIDIAQSVGARVILVTPASNLHEASPFKSEHRQNLGPEERRHWKELYDQARGDFASATPTNALRLLAEAAAIDDLPANLHFVRGRVLEKLGLFAEAKAAYERARDEDVCPLRGTSSILKILSQVATERQVPLVDFIGLIEARSAQGIPGGALFLDHVHPTIEGYRLLALEILKTMEKEGLVRPNWDPAVLRKTTEEVLSRVDATSQSLALMNLCKTLGWAGKRDEAYRAGTRALELGPNIPEVRYEVGLAAQLSGRTNEALAHYRRAVELKPAYAEAHCALGVILEDQGALADAAAEYSLALQFGKPKNVSRDRRNLATVQEKIKAQAGR